MVLQRASECGVQPGARAGLKHKSGFIQGLRAKIRPVGVRRQVVLLYRGVYVLVWCTRRHVEWFGCRRVLTKPRRPVLLLRFTVARICTGLGIWPTRFLAVRCRIRVVCLCGWVGTGARVGKRWLGSSIGAMRPNFPIIVFYPRICLLMLETFYLFFINNYVHMCYLR